MKEVDLQRQILQYLVLRGIKAWRNNTGAVKTVDNYGRRKFFRFGAVGSPDILGYLKDGRMLGIEVKTDKGKVTPAQEDFLNGMQASGCIAFVARSLDDVIKIIDSLM